MVRPRWDKYTLVLPGEGEAGLGGDYPEDFKVSILVSRLWASAMSPLESL